MNMYGQIPMKTAVAPAPQMLSRVPSATLQRKCDCGGSGSSGGECPECQKKKMARQRQANTGARPATSPAIANQAPCWPGHDFSRVGVNAVRSPETPTRLRISQPGDAHEEEADRVARLVMRVAGPAETGELTGQGQIPRPILQRMDSGPDTMLHRHPANANEEKESPPDPVDIDMPKPDEEVKSPPPVIIPVGKTWLQRQSRRGGQESDARAKQNSGQMATTASGVEEHMGGGMPLSASARAFFEPRFGYAFDQVRVHTDAHAAASARAVNAFAYTVGPHVVFGEGQYAPHSPAGRQLLAHELTHVIQQNAARALVRSPGAAIQPLGIRAGGIGRAALQRWSVEALLPGINTIVCDGAGGITTQLGAVGDANHVRCRRDCVETHEQSHRADALYENSNICKGEAAGRTVRPRRGNQKKETERFASSAEIDCLTIKLPTADAVCRPILLNRIQQMREYRESFE